MRTLLRNQGSALVGVTDTQLIGPNPRRRALFVSAPSGVIDSFISDNTLTSGASTATTGVKSSYTVPAGVQAFLTSATMFGTTGTTQVCALQIVRAATTFNLASFTGSGIFQARIPLQAGDVIQWNCTTAVAASVTDFTINVERERVVNRVTIAFGEPAVLDTGMSLNPGTAPTILLDEWVGEAFREPIHAIASNAAATISWVEIFEG